MKKLLYLVLAMLSVFTAEAQITTGSIAGVLLQDGKAYENARVTATHLPSGTVYQAKSAKNGTFQMGEVRVGGPYNVTISGVGLKEMVYNNIYVTLGSTYYINSALEMKSEQIKEVSILTRRNPLMNSNRDGTATGISNKQISTLPSISRSINDFVRLTPQSGGSNSFGGRDGRYNNIQINGANFNNNFGLSTSNLPGGQAQPISLDAIDQIQVNIAPYDVIQSNFTGANINAITRSGNNNLEGSAYFFTRNQSFNGTKVADYKLPTAAKSSTNIIGARLGGAIIKNKLFYFVNIENENNITPQVAQIADDGTGSTDPNKTTVLASDLKSVSDYLKSKYNYETGPYQGYANKWGFRNLKTLARVDWNINTKHKMYFSVSNVTNSSETSINATSTPAGVTRNTTSRISGNALTFENSNYGFKNQVLSLATGLNSRFSDKLSNNVLLTYTHIRDTRTSPSAMFPFIDILKSGQNYISAGYELFSYNNDVKNNVVTFQNNLKYTLGNHSLLAGVSFDYMTFGNSFLNGAGTGYYQYASLSDFLGNKAPKAFSYCYPNKDQSSYVSLSTGIGGLYFQDKFSPVKNLNITAGVRFDKAFYFNDLTPNNYVDTLKLRDQEGNVFTPASGQWPNTPLTVNPRLGFNYDVNGNRDIQLRGGIGTFTGRIPYVWFTNQPGSTGTLLNLVTITDSATLSQIDLQANPQTIANEFTTKFPTEPGRLVPSSGLAFVNSTFKMPRILRSNLAVDFRLPRNYILTLEGILSKDINAVYQYDANLANPQDTMIIGGTTRPYWSNSKYNSKTGNVMILSNNSKGWNAMFTTQVAKTFSNDFAFQAAYTFTTGRDMSNNPGSRALSAWQNVPNITSPNEMLLGNNPFMPPHRLMASLSKKFTYLDNRMATTVSVFYEGAALGRFSYIYTTDINKDGSTADLMYIPKNATELKFDDITSGANVLFTAQQQADALETYIAQDKYLSKHRGEVAGKFAGVLPFFNRLDLRILQDFNFYKIKNKDQRIQFSVDVINFLNILNSNWGVYKELNAVNGALLKVNSYNATTNATTYQLTTYKDPLTSQTVLPTSTFRNVYNNTSVWGIQLGLRYSF